MWHDIQLTKMSDTLCKYSQGWGENVYVTQGRWLFQLLIGVKSEPTKSPINVRGSAESYQAAKSATPQLLAVRSATPPPQKLIDMNIKIDHNSTYGLVLLKTKKALPSGMGGVFSLMVSSDSLLGRGPTGTSGRSLLSSSTQHTRNRITEQHGYCISISLKEVTFSLP